MESFREKFSFRCPWFHVGELGKITEKIHAGKVKRFPFPYAVFPRTPRA